MKKYTIIAIVSILAISSCKKREYDAPPIKEIPVGNLLTVQELRDLYQGTSVKFNEDYSVYATITMDDRSGNIYRNAYVEDQTGGILLRTNFPGGLYQGDSIRIYLKGVTLGAFNGMIQLDSVDVDKNIIKQATKVDFAPEVVKIEDLFINNYQSRLVKLENVEFLGSDLGSTYANAANQQSMNKTLIDCNDNQIIIRTSGFANFADQLIAEGSGSIVCIANEFNGTRQLIIRDINEVQMNGERCTSGGTAPENAYLYKDFSDQSLTSGGWKSYVVTSQPASRDWGVSDQGSAGNYYAVASGYAGSHNETELWLISPSVNLSEANAPQLTFRSSCNFNGPMLQLMISTDYDGTSNPSTQGTWTDYSSFVTWSPGSYTWTNSGIIPMLAFKGQTNVYMAYKYTSSLTQARTWQVDDILIDEN